MKIRDKATKNVFSFLESLEMPGLRFCENNPEVISVLKRKGFHKTPDLICGPDNLEDAPQEGFFFIDVTEPTGDFLFKQNASNAKQLSNNVSHKFRSLLGNGNQYSFRINDLPTEHHPHILKALNNKVNKYSHERLKTCNTGFVHFFNMGNYTGESYENQNIFFAMLDYLHFFIKLEMSPNKDLIEAENYFLEGLISDVSKTPYIIIVNTKWENVPVLFLMIHALSFRNGIRHNTAIVMLNSEIIINAVNRYPIHNWILKFLATSKTVFTEEAIAIEDPINFSIERDKLPFE